MLQHATTIIVCTYFVAFRSSIKHIVNTIYCHYVRGDLMRIEIRSHFSALAFQPPPQKPPPHDDTVAVGPTPPPFHHRAYFISKPQCGWDASKNTIVLSGRGVTLDTARELSVRQP